MTSNSFQKSKNPNSQNSNDSEPGNTGLSLTSSPSLTTYPNDLIGVGILSLGNRESGKWIPQGFWYSSKTVGQNKVFCILHDPDLKRSRVVPLSTLQASPTVKSLRLTKLNSKRNEDENSLRNLIYSTTSSQNIPSSKIISYILTKFVDCDPEECFNDQVLSEKNLLRKDLNVLDRIDQNIQKIRSHVLNLHAQSPSPSSPDVSSDFSVTTEIFEPETLTNVEKFEKNFFVEIYTFFK